jgi:aryl-alcohol dehydrogenase-like predicted oxidoreductase
MGSKSPPLVSDSWYPVNSFRICSISSNEQSQGFAPFYGPAKPESERFALLDRAYELGIRHWDTSDAYLDNEDMLKKYFEKYPEKRANIFLATKFGIAQNEKGEGAICGDPAYVREACERSLKRLGTQSIDLYYIHRYARICLWVHVLG